MAKTSAIAEGESGGNKSGKGFDQIEQGQNRTQLENQQRVIDEVTPAPGDFDAARNATALAADSTKSSGNSEVDKMLGKSEDLLGPKDSKGVESTGANKPDADTEKGKEGDKKPGEGDAEKQNGEESIENGNGDDAKDGGTEKPEDKKKESKEDDDDRNREAKGDQRDGDKTEEDKRKEAKEDQKSAEGSVVGDANNNKEANGSGGPKNKAGSNSAESAKAKLSNNGNTTSDGISDSSPDADDNTTDLTVDNAAEANADQASDQTDSQAAMDGNRPASLEAGEVDRGKMGLGDVTAMASNDFRPGIAEGSPNESSVSELDFGSSDKGSNPYSAFNASSAVA